MISFNSAQLVHQMEHLPFPGKKKPNKHKQTKQNKSQKQTKYNLNKNPTKQTKPPQNRTIEEANFQKYVLKPLKATETLEEGGRKLQSIY